MPTGKCPGQDNQKLTVSLHPCPQCGYRVEMFSDELQDQMPQVQDRGRQ